MKYIFPWYVTNVISSFTFNTAVSFSVIVADTHHRKMKEETYNNHSLHENIGDIHLHHVDCLYILILHTNGKG